MIGDLSGSDLRYRVNEAKTREKSGDDCRVSKQDFWAFGKLMHRLLEWMEPMDRKNMRGWPINH